VHLAHPLGVAAGEVIVHRDDMHTATGEGVEEAGQGGHEGFALAGFHFGDLALMQHHAADQLHIEVAHAQHALARFAHHRKGFGQQLIEQGALVVEAAGVLETLAEVGGAAAQVVVAEGGVSGDSENWSGGDTKIGPPSGASQA